jgi:hypothetical protein
MNKVGVTSEQLGRAFACWIRAACLHRIGAGDDLKRFGPTIKIFISWKLFAIFCLAEVLSVGPAVSITYSGYITK